MENRFWWVIISFISTWPCDINRSAASQGISYQSGFSSKNFLRLKVTIELEIGVILSLFVFRKERKGKFFDFPYFSFRKERTEKLKYFNVWLVAEVVSWMVNGIERLEGKKVKNSLIQQGKIWGKRHIRGKEKLNDWTILIYCLSQLHLTNGW